MFGERLASNAAVVVTWNRKETLRECLSKLLSQDGATCDILVVDNASTDGTYDMICEEFCEPHIRYYNTGANLGGAGGFHIGIYWAFAEGYDRVWVMDDDCYPSPTALRELTAAGEALGDRWGWLCSAIYWTDGEICTFNRPKKDVFRHVSAVDYEQKLVPAYMTSFVSVMFNANAIREVGLPHAEYFIWTDDYEYTGRIAKKYPCFVVPGSRVTHAMKSNERPSLATVEEARIGRFYFLSRNDMHCYRQHGFPGYSYLVVKAVYTALDVLIHANNDRLRRTLTMFAGIRDGWSFHPVVSFANRT